MNCRFGSLAFSLLIGILLLPSLSRADIANYGNFSGDNVEFQMVTEISNATQPLYGAPLVVGDSLDFGVPGFISQSVAGVVDFLDGRLRFMVQADQGLLIDQISVSENGAFFDFGDDSISIVSAIAFVQIDDQIYNSSFFFSNSGNGAGPWIDGLTINFPAAEKATFVLDNQLFTRADEFGAAFIDKKGLRVTVGTTAIPEPAAAALLSLLTGIAVTIRRRK